MSNKVRIKVTRHKWPDEIAAEKALKRKKIIKFIVSMLVLALVVVGAFSTGFIAGNRSSMALIDTSDATNRFKTILGLMENNWYFGKDYETLENDLVDRALVGMTTAQEDAHTAYMSKEEIDGFFASIDNQVCGIGVKVRSSEGFLVVNTVYKNSPAEESGMQKGDIIISVEGNSIEGFELDDVVSLIRGEANTPVKIGVLRGSETLEMTIIRQEVNTTVEGELLDDHIAYINLSSFGENSCDQLIEYLEDLAPKSDNLIIDLRDNGGGHLGSVVDIGSLFVEKGDIILQQEAKDGTITQYHANGNRNYSFEKIIVMVNSKSASASEVLTLALKENLDNVTIVGTKSYGKGTIQTTVYLTDGSALKYTTGKWNSPTGENIDLEGIIPDVEIDLPAVVTSGYYVIDEDETYEQDCVSVFVAQMQLALEYLDYPVDRTDGYFSSNTKQCLMNFEKKQGLTVDGILNAEDNQALFAQISVKAAQFESDIQLQKAIEIINE